MRRIALGRGYQLLPFIGFLRQLGAPVERGLDRQNLPVSLLDRPEVFVSTLAQGRFLADMAAREGIDDFGWRGASSGFRTISADLEARISASKNLLAALRAVCRGANCESSKLALWMAEREDAVYLCHRGSARSDQPGLDDLTLMRTRMLLDIVRKFTADDWLPKGIGLAISRPIGTEVAEVLCDALVFQSQRFSWIRLPRAILSNSRLRSVGVDFDDDRGSSLAVPQKSLGGAVKQLLSPFLPQRILRIGEAADLIGTSARSLQRSLAREGRTYQQLVDELRFDRAVDLLMFPEQRILDVANAVGFRDPAHFTNFFRKMTGVSPRAYRRGTRESTCAFTAPRADPESV